MNERHKKIIFLSGPMLGVSRPEALAWRRKAGEFLSGKFSILHAYRGREEKETFSDSRAAIIRDKDDILRCDIMLVNDTHENASMIGTAMEIFFAFLHNKPIIVFGNAHPKDYWLNYHIHLRTNTLKEACDLINKMFAE